VIFVEISGATIVDLMVGPLGNEQAAAYSIMDSILMIYYSVPLSINDVLMSMVGNAMGKGDVETGK